jgi:hypothetical protein
MSTLQLVHNGYHKNTSPSNSTILDTLDPLLPYKFFKFIH